MAKLWTSTGTVESVGNSTIKQNGTLYSVVKLRADDGKLQTINNLLLARNTHTELSVNRKLTFLGFKAGTNNPAYAVIHNDDLSEDVSDFARTKQRMKFAGILGIILSFVLLLTLVGIVFAIVSLPVSIIMLRNSTMLPTEDEMRHQIQESI